MVSTKDRPSVYSRVFVTAFLHKFLSLMVKKLLALANIHTFKDGDHTQTVDDPTFGDKAQTAEGLHEVEKVLSWASVLFQDRTFPLRRRSNLQQALQSDVG
jgi:hypothetical protein